MEQIFEPLYTLSSYKEINLKAGQVLATGVSNSQKWHLAAGLISKEKRPALIITHSELSAKTIYEDLRFFFGERVYIYPSRDSLFYAADVRSSDITRKRFSIIYELLEQRNSLPVVILSAETLLDRITEPDIFQENIIHIKPGDMLEPDEFIHRLSVLGYDRVAQVEGPGQFSMRGGIIDICAITPDKKYAEGYIASRIEFFGDEVDSIRELDVLSQRSLDKRDTVIIYPMGELAYNDAVLEQAIININSEYEEVYTNLRKKNLRAEASALKAHVEGIIGQLKEDKHAAHMESLFSFFYKGDTNILSYFEDAILFVDEPNYIKKHLDILNEEYEDSMKNRLSKGEILPLQTKLLIDIETVLSQIKAYDAVLFTDMARSAEGFNYKSIVNFAVKSCPPLQINPEQLKEDIRYWLDNDYKILIMAGPGRNGKQFTQALAEFDLPARYDEDINEIPAGVVTVTRGSLATGFEYPECKFVVITDREMFAKSAKRSRRRRKDGVNIDNFSDLRPGDYIVHDNHGVGIFAGIEQITTDGLSKDYLKLAYADGGHLYIHTGQMDLIQKYIGGTASLKLNKLGGADWVRAKSRVRKAVKVLAEDLIALYAKRQTTEGFIYSTDTVWQSEFENLFEYEETDDQIAAIEDVKNDMESVKIMDRLICGDVGYGKTEIAIRAAFKAVQDGKQVAYLVPTTILAQQHYLTFKSRMEDYPVMVERLSRFQTAKEQKTALARITKGEADIIIGTHRLLSKDVSFRNLGLIVVDEEQRFGVSHKEKLKALRDNVDVLTLTATPIPRTLHLSLTGIRDMSLLNEPPIDRQPVQTYVMEYNPEFVREAINRELARDGQVYYLHNRVRNIAEETARVQALVPHARVAFAHGQMSEHELENIMVSFVEGEVQVLVCTTIVETGLDIPNVNTIIIQNADYMGLSQLYQLRGRVGRANRLAYAYLMYRKDKILEEVAQKRLQTIRDFTEFGSGFKIAMRDLEIRGAGNVLGGEQHGHMDAVGYDMYCRLLAEAVAELQGRTHAQVFDTSIDVQVNAYIPEYYIEDEVQKLEMYKKISLIRTERDKDDTYEELEDRFGNPPSPVENLLRVSHLKARANKIGITAITQKQKQLVLNFKNDAEVDVDNLSTYISQEAGRITFTMSPGPYITSYIKEGVGVLDEVSNILTGLEGATDE